MLSEILRYSDFSNTMIFYWVGQQLFQNDVSGKEYSASDWNFFFTFQILSYVIDLYRGRYPVQKNILNLALYISFFPQLIAGWIVRYVDIDRQLERRTHSTTKGDGGIRRFLYGLGEKGADCKRSRTVRGQHLCDGAVRGNRGLCMAGSRNVYASDLL